MERKWWQDKTAYQIYPKSFLDTNGDGIGDLQGVIQKLDYLRELGVDIIWLSPIYCSPMADQGYDISDYYRIDPRFGNMEDMDELIKKAKEKGMYILMDLVVNHCSDEHEWFQKALKDPDGEYGKYFYIEEGKNGLPPTNWRSYFGGSAWDKIPGTNKYYLHVFHKKQPDLNWENPKLRREIYDMMNWWLEKGLAGFRIDAIINIKKALPFCDYPADRSDGMSSLSQMLAKAKNVGEFLTEMKAETFQKYDAFSVGEVFDITDDEIADFIGENGYFSSMFDFGTHSFELSEKGWYDNHRITPEDYKHCCFESQKKVREIGFLSNIIENHDEARGVSRYIPEGECNEKSKKMLAGLYFMLRGLPFIYQGQELGMENKKFLSIEEVDDVSTLDEYQIALQAGLSPKEALKAVSRYSRDNARTPFQWNGEARAGFSTGTPWLAVNDNYRQINAADQVKDKNSIFSFYQNLIALRKDPEYKETIVYGELQPVYEDVHNLMAFYRKTEGQTLLVIGNYQMQERTIVLPSKCKKVVLNNYSDMETEGSNVTLKGYQLLILQMVQ